MSYGLKDIAKDILTGKLQLSEAELAEERMKLCRQCEHFREVSTQCALCGCFLDLKVKILRASCPTDKW